MYMLRKTINSLYSRLFAHRSSQAIASYFQILSTLSFNLDIIFPGYFDDLMRLMDFINFDFRGFVPLGCIATMNHNSNLCGMTTVCLAIIIGLAVGSHVVKRRGKKKLEKQEKEEEDGKKETDWAAVLFNWLLIFTFLVLPTVSTKILHTFGCEELTDNNSVMEGDAGVLRDALNSAVDHPSEGWFLKIDRSMQCNSDQYGKSPERDVAAVYSFIMMLIFPIGIPVAHYYMLWKVRLDVDLGQLYLVGKSTAKMWNADEGYWEFVKHERRTIKRRRRFLYFIKFEWVVADGFYPLSIPDIQKWIMENNQKIEIEKERAKREGGGGRGRGV